jgi:hypothetical protein
MADVERPAPDRTDPLEHARSHLERAQDAGDEDRLEALEAVRETLESELEASVEDDAPGR